MAALWCSSSSCHDQWPPLPLRCPCLWLVGSPLPGPLHPQASLGHQLPLPPAQHSTTALGSRRAVCPGRPTLGSGGGRGSGRSCWSISRPSADGARRPVLLAGAAQAPTPADPRPGRRWRRKPCVDPKPPHGSGGSPTPAHCCSERESSHLGSRTLLLSPKICCKCYVLPAAAWFFLSEGPGHLPHVSDRVVSRACTEPPALCPLPWGRRSGTGSWRRHPGGSCGVGSRAWAGSGAHRVCSPSVCVEMVHDADPGCPAPCTPHAPEGGPGPGLGWGRWEGPQGTAGRGKALAVGTATAAVVTVCFPVLPRQAGCAVSTGVLIMHV